MRLLFLTAPFPYPPRQGATLRSWGFIRELARRHEVHLLALAPPGQRPPPEALDFVRRHLASAVVVPAPPRSPARRLRQLLTRPEPDVVLRLWTPAFARALAEALSARTFDAVQVVGLELAHFAEPFLHAGGSGPAWVYDALNAETELQRTIWQVDARRPRRWPAAAYSFVQWLKLRRYERRWLPRYHAVVCVSEEDARHLRRLAGVSPLVVPNGVDTDHLDPRRFAPQPDVAREPAVVFVGKMDFRPNVDGARWFAEEIWPRVRRAVPQARFWVVGQAPTASVRALHGRDGIVVTGTVPEVEPYLVAARAVVVPLRMGSGTRLKVLQALSLARPVVSTSLGCAGLGLQSGVHLWTADAPADFAEAVVALLRDAPAADRLGREGRAFVRRHFDWKVLTPHLEALYDRLAAGP